MLRGASAEALAELGQQASRTRTLEEAATLGTQLFGVAAVVRECEFGPAAEAIGELGRRDLTEERDDLLLGQRLASQRPHHSALAERDRLSRRQPKGIGRLLLHHAEETIKTRHGADPEEGWPPGGGLGL